MHIFSIILLTIVSITLIVVVLMQPSKTNGLSGFMGGGSETFYSKNRTRTSESVLSRITVICSILFAIIVLAQNLLAK
ncbi:preprotein translocase subunit SecG [Clostridium botulinum]|nr:preprotein translocase subunit SecG [Clostridium botulinum]NFP54693.1 preprotein translocase subunit SecG [Clostridium botulinum]NFT10414.1 preprotein translocase subunit SecG [Clostridium botulinum]NFT60756.1 preprotein translocase subunit SecG [Clostridium botulinum]